ncbi:sugar phosphate isomerase/epimerase [Rothia sp. ZJ932]|uniref:sugar phosphate isomerase/epimerase family protein n=1 Tax=Rothia sp. ZJ932 TaxID=2810516 RepID=UPI0019679E36|nr:sugar phosphate isomerase/epimerase [Rothia sp. ZJ932]QRZ61488.1 TIM barrel protein [Rothia sp. ZJ932]
MKLGVYSAILHDRTLEEALKVVSSLGLKGYELNTGGFLPPVHVPIDEILNQPELAEDYLSIFRAAGVEIAGLNCNGNPLHPNREIGEKHAEDLRKSIRLAPLLGQTRVVTMSGLPGSEPDTRHPAWHVNTWSSGTLDSLEYQWEVAVDFWQEIEKLAAENGVKVAIELHPQNLVFNPPTAKRLVERVNAQHIGVELDASHLFWQQMDPIKAVQWLGDLTFHAAAKDIRINRENAEIVGVLDERFRRLSPEEDRVNIGGNEWVNEWPQDSAWDFVAVGVGHNANYWAEFMKALHEVDSKMWLNIEHEDTSMGRVEGLKYATKTLTQAAKIANIDIS